MRPSWDSYWLSMADLVATRSTCMRAQVGCVITRHNTVLASGYNGSPPAMLHCTDIGCLMIDGHCERTNHAEINAICQVANSYDSADAAVAYITHQPCYRCARTLIQVGISRIVYGVSYTSIADVEQLCKDANVRLEKL